MRRALSVAAIGAGLLAPMIVPSAAWSGGTAPDRPVGPSAAALALRDDAVLHNAVAHALNVVGDADPAFATVKRGAADDEFVIYRKGGRPDDRYAPAAQRALGSIGKVRVGFATAPLTRQESNADVDALWKRRDTFTERGIVLTGVATQWSGPVIVYVKDAAAVSRATALAAELAPHGPATVTVEQLDPLRPATRFNDLKPLTAGNRILSATGVLVDGSSGFVSCTSGFGGRSSDNRRWMITAYHCVRPGDPRFWAAGSGATYNGAGVLDSGHDIAYIETFGSGGPGTNNRVWDGPRFPESAAFRKIVTSAGPPEADTRYCVSGSFSGIRCYGELGGGGHFTLENPWRDGADEYNVYLHWMDPVTGTGSQGGQGDSGAPIFQPLGGSNVRAIGMYSAGSGSATCVGEDGGRECYRRSYFTNIHAEAVVNHGLSLTTP